MTGATAAQPQVRPWLRNIVTGAFALLYAYIVWNALLENLVPAVQTAAAVGKILNVLGWGLWLFAAVLPIVVFAAALRLCWRGGTTRMLLILFTGLTVVAVFWLNVQSYALTNTAALLS